MEQFASIFQGNLGALRNLNTEVGDNKRVVAEHWLEIIIGLVATAPFVTSYLGIWLKRVDPLVWLSILFFVLIWSRIASS